MLNGRSYPCTNHSTAETHQILKGHAGQAAPAMGTGPFPRKFLSLNLQLASNLFWLPTVPVYNRPRLQSSTPTRNLPYNYKSKCSTSHTYSSHISTISVLKGKIQCAHKVHSLHLSTQRNIFSHGLFKKLKLSK
jgi:hypothetical protein